MFRYYKTILKKKQRRKKVKELQRFLHDMV